MIKIFIILFFLAINYSFNMDDIMTFENKYSQEIKWANNYIYENKSIIDSIFINNNIDIELGLSIMFPELVRYNFLKDQIEISLNKILYVNGGLEYSDLSIGVLQMKPSFIKRLSNSHRMSNYELLFEFNNKLNDEDIRAIIIQRLQKLSYQLLYLSYFINIIDNHIQNYNFSNSEKIKYISTAYNSGAWYNISNNEKYSQKKTYPNGPDEKKIIQYSFSDISLYYYNKLKAN